MAKPLLRVVVQVGPAPVYLGTVRARRSPRAGGRGWIGEHVVPGGRTSCTLALGAVVGLGLVVGGAVGATPGHVLRWGGLAVLLVVCTGTLAVLVEQALRRLLATIRHLFTCPHCGRRPTDPPVPAHGDTANRDRLRVTSL